VNLNTAQTTAVSLATGADKSGFTAPNFVMKHVLVANGWSANGPEKTDQHPKGVFVSSQTEGLAPLSLGQREPVKTVMVTLQGIAGVFIEELKPDSLKLGGVIKPDDVPPDRLTAVPAGAPAPSKTAAQRRDEEAAKRKAEADGIANTFKAKTNALNDAITNTKNQINTCKADKQAEYDRNIQDCRREDYCERSTGGSDGIVYVCWDTYQHWRLVCTRKTPPGGPGTSYTPNADASVACHAGLDAQIADLQAKLNDPDLQSAKTESDKQLKDNPNLVNDPVFMQQRNDALNKLNNYQSQIDDLKRQKNGI
jgi:hypothetical protein